MHGTMEACMQAQRLSQGRTGVGHKGTGKSEPRKMT